jgi:hypothetical protein
VVSGQVRPAAPTAPACALVLPIISLPGERVRRLSDRRFVVSKAGGDVAILASAPIEIADTGGGDRVFNLVPGFCAVPFVVAVPGGRVECSIRRVG